MLVPVVLLAAGLEASEPYHRIGGAVQADARIAPHLSFDVLVRARHYQTLPDECTQVFAGMEYDLMGGLRGDVFDTADQRHFFPFLAFDAGGRWVTAQSICSPTTLPTESHAEAALTVGLDVLSLSRAMGVQVVLRGSKLLGVDYGRTVDGGGALMFLARF
jgi:hypothetical protein